MLCCLSVLLLCDCIQVIFTTMIDKVIAFVTWPPFYLLIQKGGQVTKPIIRSCENNLHIIKIKEY